MDLIPVKYSFEGSLRRANVPVSYAALEQQFRDSFPKLSAADVTVSYKDEEGDTIVVQTNEELQAAQDCFRRQNKILALQFELRNGEVGGNCESGPAATETTKTETASAETSETSHASSTPVSTSEATATKKRLQKLAVRRRRVQARADARQAAKTRRENIQEHKNGQAAGAGAPSSARIKKKQLPVPQPHQSPHPVFGGKMWILAPHTRVRVTLNQSYLGQTGTVQHYDATAGRYLVQMDTQNGTLQPTYMSFAPNQIRAVNSAQPGVFAQQPMQRSPQALLAERNAQEQQRQAQRQSRAQARFNRVAMRNKQKEHERGVLGATFMGGLAGFLCGGFLMAFIAAFIVGFSTHCLALKNVRRTRVKRAPMRRLTFHEKMFKLESAVAMEALPFIQIIVILLSWMTGCSCLHNAVWMTSMAALAIRAARAMASHKETNCCQKFCKGFDKCVARLKNKDKSAKACGGSGPSRRELGLAFIALLGVSVTFFIVTRIPTLIFWLVHFVLPRAPKPAATQPAAAAAATTPNTATRTATRTATPNTSTRTAATASTAAASSASVSTPLTATVAAQQGQLDKIMLDKIIAAIHRCPAHKREGLSNALDGALARNDSSYAQVRRLLRASGQYV